MGDWERQGQQSCLVFYDKAMVVAVGRARGPRSRQASLPHSHQRDHRKHAGTDDAPSLWMARLLHASGKAAVPDSPSVYIKRANLQLDPISVTPFLIAADRV